MYIHFKSKYKKILWFIIGFILACFYIQKVNAQDVTIENGNVSDIDFTFNGVTYNYEKIKNDIDIQLSGCGKTLEDFDNFILRLPSQPSTSSTGNNGFYRTMQLFLFNADVTSYYFRQSIQESGLFDTNPRPLNYSIITWNFSTKNVSSNCSASGTLNNFNGESSTKYFSYYSNINWHNIDNMNANQSYPVYSKLLIDNSLFYTLPDYLNGYKKITLTSDDKYYMLSGLSSGSVYIPTSDFEEYGGLLSYYDNDLTSQPYTSYIQDYYKMPDGEFIRQDFDLSSYYGADFVMFSKYIYLDGEDNISYDIWVPNDIYDSQVTITPNSSGGNTFDFDYQDSNGDIQNGQVNSVDLSQDNPLLGNIFTDFSSNTFGLTSIVTAPLSLISSLSSTSCSNLSVPLPFISSNLTLPCMSTIYSNTFGSFFTLYQTITTGIISYWVIVKIFNLVKDFKNPDHDEIEVIDL